jgi:phosphoglycerate kinase
MNKKTVRDIDVAGKRVLMRVDFNAPLNEKREVTDDSRIRAALPTIQYLLNKNAKVILVSHLGRPKGKVDEVLRLDPVDRVLENLLGKKVLKLDKVITEEVEQAVKTLNRNQVILLENVRFYAEEQENVPEFAKKLASLADIFVDDAFGTAHRAHASTVGVTKYLPSVAGFLLEKEVDALTRLIQNPAKPFIAILGGNKVSDKIGVIKNLLETVDGIVMGGGMCFTFLKAQGYEIGGSILEPEQLEEAKHVLEYTEREGILFYLPEDVVVADSFSADAKWQVVNVEDIPPGRYGLDIGPMTVELYQEVILEAKTIFWNGPMGVFEWDAFANGTRKIAEAIAHSNALTIVGGGDSDAALKKFNLTSAISHISTGGGASMRVLEGKPLPAVEALMDK